MKQYKKYRNRKLYDTSASKYVTLEEIMYASLEMEVQVVDFIGNDITSPTLLEGFLKVIDKEGKKRLLLLAREIFVNKTETQNLTVLSQEDQHVD